MHLLIELISIRKNSTIHICYILSRCHQDSSAKSPDMCELIQMGQRDLESLVPSPRKSGHRTMVTVCFYTKRLLHKRYNVSQKDITKRSTELITCLSFFCPVNVSAITVIHYHNHRFAFPACYLPVQNIGHVPLFVPPAFIFTHTML